jgi:C4-dicarboxylate transporter DctM subunit
VLLLAINVFLIIVGGLIDPTPATLVLTPLLLPIVKAVGVDPVHFGSILTVNLSMGMFTTPFALNIFMAQALFGAPTSKIYPGLVPFIVMQILALRTCPLKVVRVIRGSAARHETQQRRGYLISQDRVHRPKYS